MGPTVWMMCLQGRLPADVWHEAPTKIGPCVSTYKSDSFWICLPPFWTIAPASPPPCFSFELAAFVIASYSSSVRSFWIISIKKRLSIRTLNTSKSISNLLAFSVKLTYSIFFSRIVSRGYSLPTFCLGLLTIFKSSIYSLTNFTSSSCALTLIISIS